MINETSSPADLPARVRALNAYLAKREKPSPDLAVAMRMAVDDIIQLNHAFLTFNQKALLTESVMYRVVEVINSPHQLYVTLGTC